MAAAGEPRRNIGGGLYASSYSNGHDRETAIVDSVGDDSMEDMLREATDMQADRGAFRSGRLQLQSDDSVSPFGYPAPQPPAYTSSPGTTLGSGSHQSHGYSHPTPGMAPTSRQVYGSQPPFAANGEQSGTQLVRGPDTSAKLDSLRRWTLSTYKYTKQMVSERMGRRMRTVDAELEKHIAALRDTQVRYGNLLKLANQFSSQFAQILGTQKALGEAFTELSMKSPDLQDEFSQNGDLQKVLCKNGESLRCALDFFTSNLQTLSTKTIDDTIMTIREYESARIQYDAYRTDLEELELQGQSFKTEEARKVYYEQKQAFEKLRENLQIKLKFLEENKVKVMRKQLLMLHNALAAYFSGNREELEKTMKEFHIRVMSKGDGQSFLETH